MKVKTTVVFQSLRGFAGYRNLVLKLGESWAKQNVLVTVLAQLRDKNMDTMRVKNCSLGVPGWTCWLSVCF